MEATRRPIRRPGGPSDFQINQPVDPSRDVDKTGQDAVDGVCTY
jgi:hypothetical protein